MKKRYLPGTILLCGFLMMVSLAGCGKKETVKKEENTAVSQVTTQAEERTEEEATTEPAMPATTETADSTEAVFLTGNTASSAKASETDYSKVNWGVSYSPFEDKQKIVFSIAPYYDGFSWYLVIGITNNYDQDLAIYGEGSAKNAKDETVGSITLYETCVGSGNTVIETILCTDEPDGRIGWTGLKTEEADGKYVPWEADWSLQQNSPGFTYSYSLYSKDSSKTFVPDGVTALLLDSEGNIMALGEDYVSDKITSDQTWQSTISVYVNGDGYDIIDSALFVNPKEAK